LKGGSVASWQVYADTGPVHKIMDRYQEERPKGGEHGSD